MTTPIGLLTFNGIRCWLAASFLIVVTTLAFAAWAPVALHAGDRAARESVARPAAPTGSDRFISRLSPTAGASSTGYVRRAADYPQRDERHLSDLKSVEHERERSNLIDGILYGLLLGAIMCNGVLTLAFRERLYLFNLMGCLFGLTTLILLNGHGRRYLPSDVVPYVQYFVLALPALWSMVNARFANLFLNLARHAPVASKLTVLIQVLALVVVVLGFMQHIQAAYLVLFIVGTLGPLTGTYGAIRAYRQGFSPAKWYLLGVLILLASIASIALIGVEAMPQPEASDRLELGITLECVLFTLALGSRIYLRRDLVGMSTPPPTDLEDPLYTDRRSGAKNALGWSKLAPGLLTQSANTALIAIYFEGLAAFEKTHGEALHSQLLRQLAGRISMEMGAEDLCARTSPEEFNVLLTDVPDREILALRIEIILDNLDTPLDVQGEIFEPRASVGVALFPLDGFNLDSLTQAANHTRNFVRDQGGLGYAIYQDVVPA